MSSTPNSGQATPKLSDEELKAFVRERFTKTAEVFGDYAVTHRITEAETLARMVSANANDRAVDLACGPVTLASRFEKQLRWICGLDFPPAILERPRRTAEHEGLVDKLTFAIGDAQA